MDDADRVDLVVNRNGAITVSRTVMGQTTSSSEVIKVRPFRTSPAYVSVAYGGTVNLGNFNSFRTNVSISLPCYAEEVFDVYNDVREKVEELVAKEITEAQKSRV